MLGEPDEITALRSQISRERHVRSLWFLVLAAGLAIFAFLFLGFDRMQAAGYAVSCFVMLNLANSRAMYSRLPEIPDLERFQGQD